jgi:hypothetical protein
MGFGFEGITGASTRSEIMGRAVDYLLRSPAARSPS